MSEWIFVRECITERRADGVFVAGPGPTFENGWRNTQACFMACEASLAGRWCPCHLPVSRSDESATVEERYEVESARLQAEWLKTASIAMRLTFLKEKSRAYENADDFTKLAAMYLRAVIALRLIGWSYHTFSPRLGPKAQAARWGLDLDEFPKDWNTVLGSAE